MPIVAKCPQVSSPSTQWSWTPRIYSRDPQPELPIAPPANEPALPYEIQSDNVGQIAVQFARLIVEVIRGSRNPAQLVTWFDAEPMDCLAGRIPHLRDRHVGLGSVHIQTTQQGSAEVTVRLTASDCDRAAAMRLSAKGEHWRCTALLIG